MEAAHGVVLGFDVGRYSHHMTAIDARTGEVAASKPVAQGEPDIREALGPYAGEGAIVVVDQPGDLSSLLFAVAGDMGMELGFITPKAMAKGIDLYGGEAKTDARDSLNLLEHFLGEGRRKVTLDDLEERALARDDPEFFLQTHRPPVFIDEVQYAPELFPYLKIYADRNPDDMGAVWLTGSQPFALMELAGESLAGRVGILHLLPLSQGEAHGDSAPIPLAFGLDALEERARHREPATVEEMDERIWRGSMPAVVSGRHTDPARFYRNYQQTYIERDVREVDGAAGLVDFSRFMRAAAAQVGQLLNVESLARDVDIPRRKAQEWLGILERSDVVFLLQPYSNNALSRAVKTPKLYFTDTGLAAWLGRWTSPASMSAGAKGGDLFENYVVSEVRKSLNNAGQGAELWFYRDRDAKEIDLVIERDGALTPIEVKRGASPRRSASSAFGLLDRSGLERSTGAVVCMKEHVGHASRDCLYVPAWVL